MFKTFRKIAILYFEPLEKLINLAKKIIYDPTAQVWSSAFLLHFL